MKTSRTLITLATLVLMLFAGSMTMAQEKMAEGENCSSGMTPEQMAKWAEIAAVTENHKALESMVGSWTTTSKYWAAPGGEPMLSTGTCVNSWVLGGRYMMSDYKGDMMGQVFEGIGYMGYDNAKQKYTHLWMDSMSTMWMTSEGTMEGSTCTLLSEYDDPMSGQKVSMRQEVKVIDNDHPVVNMYASMPDGKEFQMMEIKYTRQ